MPRPKRSKVAPSIPVSKRSQPTKPAAPVAKETQSPTIDFDDIYDASDREYGSAAVSRRVRNTTGKVGTGGRNVRDLSGEVEDNRAAEAQASDHEDLPLDLDDSLQDSSDSPGIERGRRSVAAVDSSTYNIGNFKRRARQPSLLGRANEKQRSSSIESDLAEGTGLTGIGKKNTSVLSVTNFKRRARQPSIIGRNATRARSSSIGLEMGNAPGAPSSAYKIGTFKRRAREPSILRTAQKRRQPRPNFESDDDEDDFNPEDESTPLHPSKPRSSTEHHRPQSATSTPASNSRKRKLSAIQIPQSQTSPLPSVEPEEAEEIVPATAEDGSDDNQERSKEPEIPFSHTPTPELLDETMAPPRSSSPMSASPELPSVVSSFPRGRRILRGRTPPPATQDSPISSPPSLTHSPNRPTMAAARAGTKRQPPQPSTLSTAQLQGLLPRRRRRPAADPFDVISDDDVDASGLASEDDELSHLTVRPRRRSGLLTRKPAPLKRAPKPKAGMKKTSKRTYGSRTSDKENEDADVDPDDSLAPIQDIGNVSSENSQEMEARLGKELKKAARKFQEVDKWELEFEEVTASSSSPREAR
ncbi:hypothetical protein BP5796_10068 [Coleophoma crateriformis]|uniref:Uncharacterized protein n=1 Tax=Coleophoma crateriformis TaxID=565419 RepID=A0A3D8QU52_9HELO|nr:hypothetical protein BP5796_10068 [Coleophoma crateriformis]